MEFLIVPEKEGKTDMEELAALLDSGTACFYGEAPNFYGIIEDYTALGEKVHEAGAKYILGCNPISLGLLRTPAEYGADVAVGEGQPLGMELSFGGPYLGFMAATKEMMRKLPGRIVGETTDHDGRRAFVLTLQAREQHIRREKASSNICSNQALCAMTAAVYLSAMGENGMRQVAQLCICLLYTSRRFMVMGLPQYGQTGNNSVGIRIFFWSFNIWRMVISLSKVS